MEKIGIVELKKITTKYGLKVCAITGTDVVNICKHPRKGMREIPLKDFELILKRKKLAIYKAPNDWLKIMKN